MENKLISMVDFLIRNHKDRLVHTGDEYNSYLEIHAKEVYNYANFLKQPLEIWMFIPCKLVDGVWKPLITPSEHNPIYWSKEYQEAKDRVLFEGFSISYQEETNDTFGFYTLFKNSRVFIKFQKTDQLFVHPDNKIENLTKYNIQLTPTALKQISR